MYGEYQRRKSQKEENYDDKVERKITVKKINNLSSSSILRNQEAQQYHESTLS